MWGSNESSAGVVPVDTARHFFHTFFGGCAQGNRKSGARCIFVTSCGTRTYAYPRRFPATCVCQAGFRAYSWDDATTFAHRASEDE